MERAARERPELGASSCEQAVDALVEALPARYLEALRDPRVEGVRIRGERATAIVLPPKEVQEAAEKAGNAEQLGNRVPLRLIDGEWKIDAIFG